MYCSNLSLFKHNCAHKECHNCVWGSSELWFLWFLSLLLHWHAVISHTVWRAPDNLVLITSRWFRFCVFSTFGCQVKSPPDSTGRGFSAAAVAKFCWRFAPPSHKPCGEMYIHHFSQVHFNVIQFTYLILAERGSDKNRLLSLCD